MDQVPVVPLIISHSVRRAGVPFRRYNTDAELLATCQVLAWQEYGYDGFHISSDNWVLPEALGVEVEFYDDRPPTGVARPLQVSKDMALLPSIEAARTAGRMRLLPAATRLAVAQVGTRCFIKTNFDQGPFSLATAVRGIEQLMLDMVDDPQFVLNLLEYCTRVVIHLGCETGRAGAHAVSFGDSVAGLISREHFARFALPFEQEVIRCLHRALDVPVFLHICGRTSHILDLMAGSGADALELDHFNDFGAVSRKIGDQLCLEGNIDPVGVMRCGAPDDVTRNCHEVITATGGRGLILSPGCELPPDTPPNNIRAMVSAAKC